MVRIRKKARVETAAEPEPEPEPEQEVLCRLPGDEFLADEIFSRLPASSAARCAGLSRGIRSLLTAPEFWLRRRSMLTRPRLAAEAQAPQSPPAPFSQLFQNAACLTRLASYFGGNVNSTHIHAFGRAPDVYSIRHRVDTAGPYDTYDFAGTCNGLVLLVVVDSFESWLFATKKKRQPQRHIDAVVVNPASREEEAVRISLPPPPPECDRYGVDVCGFGYSPSTRAYKALIVEWQRRGDRTASKLMVAPFGGSPQQAPRTVLSCDQYLHYGGCLSTDDDGGMVYLLANPNPQLRLPVRCSVVLALSIDDESATAVTTIPLPPGRPAYLSGLMKIWGRPCVAMHDDAKNTVVLWTLAPAAAAAAATEEANRNRWSWERRCALIYKKIPGHDHRLCKVDLRGVLVHRNHLLALFEQTYAHLYNLRKKPLKRDGGAHRPSWTSENVDDGVAPVPMFHPYRDQIDFLWGYQPTLISPATVFGSGGPAPGRGAGCLTRVFRSGGGRCRHGSEEDATWDNYLDVVVGMLQIEPVRRQSRKKRKRRWS